MRHDRQTFGNAGGLIIAWTLMFFIVLAQGDASGQIQLARQKASGQSTAPMSSVEKIDRAYAMGQISLDDWALLTAYALFEPSQLPPSFHGSLDRGFDSSLRLRFFQIWHQLSESTRQQLAAYGFLPNGAMSRPTGLDSVRTTEHFKIHYSVAAGDTNAIDPTDADKNGTPDYIDMVMRILEEVYTYEIDSMKYTAPPPDSLENGKAYYDVYIMKLKRGIYGYVQSEKVVGDNSASANRVEKNAAFSYMALRNNYAGFKNSAERNLKVTIAHEFFHAIQNGYDVYEKAWLFEATATWIEDEVYDDINDNYQYLPEWFDRPWVALDATPSEADPNKQHWYGSWIFFRYLSEHLGSRDVVRKVWEYSVSYNSKLKDYSFNAIRDAVSDYNKTFSQVFTDFHVANLIKTISPYHYEEGDKYPDIYNIQVGVPHYKDQTFNMRYSADFYKIFLPFRSRPEDEVEVKVKVLDSLATFIVQIVEVAGNKVTVTKLNPRTKGSHTVRNLGALDRLHVIVVNMDAKGKSNQYEIEIIRKIQLTRIMPGFFVAKNKFLLASFVKDTLRVFAPDWTPVFSNIQSFKLSFNSDLVAFKDNNEELYIFYEGKLVNVIPDSGIDKNAMVIAHELTAIHGNSIWSVNSAAVYQAFSSGKGKFRLRKISTEGIGDLSYRRDEEKLMADSVAVVWLDSYWTDSGGGNYIYHSEFWKAVGTQKERIAQFQSDNIVPIIQDWDYRHGMLVFFENVNTGVAGEKITYVNLETMQQETVAQTEGANLLKTFGKKIAWTIGETVYLWDNGQIQKIYEPDSVNLALQGTYSWLDMDSTGVAWMQVKQQGSNLLPKFYYYDFKTQTTSTMLLDDFNLYKDPIVTRRGDRIKLHDGLIYFTAFVINSSVKWPYVFEFQPRDMVPTGIHRAGKTTPVTFDLKPNYPNPFRDQTTLQVVLSKPGPVEIRVYDILGRLVYSELRKAMPAGEHRIALQARNWGSGLYFYRVKVGPVMKSGKMLIVR